MKERKDIRSFKFYMNLSKSTTIQVPVKTAGNIRGLYDLDKGDGKYFRIVNLDDPDFQKRDIHFQVDGDFTEGFSEVINFVSVSFRKQYGTERGNETSDTALIFGKKDLNEGVDLKMASYPRLGLKGSDWLAYDYRVTWSIKGLDDAIYFPNQREQWERSSLPSIALTPPFKKRVVEIDADRQFFKEQEIRSATIRFFVILGSKPMSQKNLMMRQEDTVNTNKLVVYCDEGEPIAYKVSWYSKNGEYHEELKVLDGEYLFLIPPDKEKLKK